MSPTLNHINEKVVSHTHLRLTAEGVQREPQKKLNLSFVVQISRLIVLNISQVECIWLSHAIGGPDESP
jgi:hypothetical protein